MPDTPSTAVVPVIDTFVLGDYMTNCHVVTTPGHDTCWIVDCGIDPDVMLDAIEQRNLTPTALLLTHAHVDHMAGVDAALARFGDMPMYLHEAERAWTSDAMLNLSALGGRPVTCRDATNLLHGGETLNLNGTTWDVIHAPGHSPGSVVFAHRPSNQAIVGDTLFAGSIGRYDFPTSSHEDLRHTIAQVMMALPDDMTIHPGHGRRQRSGTNV